MNPSYTDQAGFNYHICCPKIYFRVLFFAVCFLLFYISENLDTTERDKSTVQMQIEAIYQIFSNSPSSDEHKHTGKNIIALKSAIKLGIKSSNYTVKTWFGASMFFNALRATKWLKHRDLAHKQVEISDSGYSEPGLLNHMEYEPFLNWGLDFLVGISLGIHRILHW